MLNDKDMLNYNRRKKQAFVNSRLIIEMFSSELQAKKEMFHGIFYIRNENEVMDLLKKLIEKVESKARHIQPDWSIPIILEAIGISYYGNSVKNKKMGIFLKRALVYLWKSNNGFADKKNIESILEIIRLSYVIENLYACRRFFLVIENFSFKLNGGYCIFKAEDIHTINEFCYLLKGKGRRLRIAKENSNLMCTKSEEFLNALQNILEGENPNSITIFKDTFYEHIPSISNNECKKFWQGLYTRYSLFRFALINECLEKTEKKEEDFCPSVTLFPEFSLIINPDYCTQEIVKDIFWTKKWIKSKDNELYSNLIVERPILRITQNGDFATCSALIGDSINNFLEKQIFDYPFREPKINLPPFVFKSAISAPFENKVISEFRKKGFLAGHVSDNGAWQVQNKTISLNCTLKLYGEIDALAYMSDLNLSILVECKVLNDVNDYRSYKNIISKIVDDDEGFQSKLLEKSKWVNKVLTDYYKKDISTVCVLLTDISLPIVNFHNEDIIFTSYDLFFQGIEQILSEFKHPDGI